MTDGVDRQFAALADATGAAAHLRQLVLQLAVRGFARDALPPGWRWTRLGDLAELSIGKTPPTGSPDHWARGTEGHPWVTIADMRMLGAVQATRRRVSDHAAETFFRGRRARAGTLIMSFKLTLGRVSLLGVDAFHNEAIVAIAPHRPELRDYLVVVLPALARRAVTRAAVKGATLNRASLAELPVPLPPDAEREQLVARVQALLARCDRLEAKERAERVAGDRLTRAALADGGASIVDELATVVDRAEKVDALEAAIVRLGLEGRLTPRTGPRRRRRLDEIAAWAGGSPFPLAAQGRTDLPLLFCKVSDMNLAGNARHIVRTVHTIDEPTARALGARVHPAGTVVFPKIGGAIATNKRRILERPGAIDNNCLGLVPGESCSSEFLHLLLRSIDLAAYQSSGAVPSLAQARVGAIEIELPSRVDQDAIVHQVDRLGALCASLRTGLTRAAHAADALMIAAGRELLG